jgi:hypothetical protein
MSFYCHNYTFDTLWNEGLMQSRSEHLSNESLQEINEIQNKVDELDNELVKTLTIEKYIELPESSPRKDKVNLRNELG